MQSEQSIRVYIAGPMTGYPDFNYPAFFERARLLWAAGYDPVNPANIDNGAIPDPATDTRTYEDYLRAGFGLLLSCQAISLLPNWEKSTGAVREKQIADWLKIVEVKL